MDIRTNSEVNLLEAIGTLISRSTSQSDFLKNLLEYGAIHPFIDSIFITEWMPARDDFRYLYVGDKITQQYKFDVIGTTILEHEVTATRLEAVVHMKQIVNTRLPVLTHGTYDLPDGYSRWDQLMLPIIEDNYCNKVFGYIGYS